jgi:hypothetical protein
MSAVSPDNGWKVYAVTGRPDFLNYLHRGDVTWSQLWDFYREFPADPDAMVHLMGLFHLFQSADYDAEGGVLDRDGRVYGALREWAGFVVECQEFLPEEKLSVGLGALLAGSLISALYYEAVFNVYLEASLERRPQLWLSDPQVVQRLQEGAVPEAEQGSLRICLSQLTPRPEKREGGHWEEDLSQVVRRHYALWSGAYSQALGEEEPDWRDEGGEG